VREPLWLERLDPATLLVNATLNFTACNQTTVRFRCGNQLHFRNPTLLYSPGPCALRRRIRWVITTNWSSEGWSSIGGAV